MGFIQDIKNKVLIRDPEERKYFEEQLEKERQAALKTAKIKRREELTEMARFQAQPRGERIKQRLQSYQRGAQKAAGFINGASKKFEALDEKGRKMTNGGGALGRAMSQDKMQSNGGQLAQAMERQAGVVGKKMVEKKPKSITIRFD